MKKKKLGELLINEGLITEEQLDNALTLQKGKNKKIGKVLIELGYINEVQVAEILTKQLSLKLVDCDKHNPSKEVLSLVPKATAERKLVLPLEQNGRVLMIVMANPLDWETIEDLSFETGMRITVAISSENNILNAIERLYGSADDTWDVLKELPSYDGVEFVKEEVDDEKQQVSFQSLYQNSEAPPIVRLVTMIIADAVNYGASDIHIEPREKNVQVRYRMDGALKNIQSYPKQIQDAVISRIKIISNLDITNRRFPQDGRSALRLEKKNVDLRISTLPSIYGEKVVIRLLDPTTGLIPLSKLGISKHILKPLIEVFSQPQGMLLVTGPTGSGKTTTLYSILQQLRTETKNIITLEDPVEYKLAEITQVGINDAIGFTFANALRSVLRQDPDIVMVGEIRDIDTAEIGARAALTGHFVLSTLHTNDTVSTISRLIDIGLEPFLVTSAVSGVIAQRLIRTICPACKTMVSPPEEAGKFNLPPLTGYYSGKGCDKCNHTGYKGRVGVYELIKMDTKLKRLISKSFTEDDLWECVRESGTKTMFEDAWLKIQEGITTFDEVISKIPFQEITPEEKIIEPVSI
ncbi:MAG TPA: type II secretion system protein GspE [Nitrospirae bacterium]|nr:type II secretion system protein E [bacterium BMS3Abin06]HDH13203.1 type II secretion system protein GspE [Nitrospirota bacterium]HDZ01943.1 type II secretion system protein GspE [Nitrospirota bacterium]